MPRLALILGLILLTVPASPASAGDFDGSKLLICAPIEALDCAAGGGCVKGTPEEIGAPAFVRVNVGQKAVIGPKRTSLIQSVEKTDEQLLLQGTELGLAWTIALDQETGKMAVTLANRDGVFVLFGACTLP